MTYDEAIAYLYGLERDLGWDLKLERVRVALERLGSPERRFPSVLVAGTNGKGATSALVHEVACQAGLRVGLYTSPHLVSFTERIRIGKDEISRERVASGVARLARTLEGAGIQLTYFEMATVLAFEELARDEVELAVLEVGLGGRLDATNVVEPEVSAVVSIGYDHQEFLGDTLAAIAREKAGVMRAGRAVVLGDEMPEEAHVTLLSEAARIGALVTESRPFLGRVEQLTLRGRHMRRNAAVAVGILEELGRVRPGLRMGPEHVRAGLSRVRWPGRLAVVQEKPLVVADGAHNLEGVAALLEALPEVIGDRRPRLVFAALADKPWRAMAAVLSKRVGDVVVTRVGGERGVAVDALAAAFAGTETGAARVTVEPEPRRALRDALARDDGAPLLVAGSLFLVGILYELVLERRGLASVFDLDLDAESQP